MKIHEERVFKVPVDEIRLILQKQYQVDLSGIDPYLEGEFIVFSIQMGREVKTISANPSSQTSVEVRTTKSRKRRRKRNRIKTRGWNIIDQITNSKGLKANVYEPFVEAIKDHELSKTDQKEKIKKIMIANNNKPTDESIEYHLNNTLEYLSLIQTPKNNKKPSDPS